MQSTINGCVGPRAQVNVGVGPGFIANAGLDTNICTGGSANLAVSPNSASNTYNWSEPGITTIGTLFNQAVTPINITTYTVEVVDTFGCIAIDSVIVKPMPIITVPANLTYCTGDNVPASVFTSTPVGATFDWTNNNTLTGLPANGMGNTSAFTATNGTNLPNISTILVTPTLNGCQGTGVSYDIIVNPTPIAITADSVLICINNTATLTATAPGTPYEWYDAAIGGTLLFTGTSYTTPVLNASTSYWVQATTNGCIGPRIQIYIIIGPGFIADAGLDVDICFGETTNLTVSPNSASNTYNWSEPGIPTIGTLFNQAVTPIDTTVYTIEVVDTFGCIAIDNIIVNVNPIPAVSVPPNLSYCAGDAIPASAYISTPTGSTYDWFHTNTAIGLTVAIGTSNTPEFTATNTTLFPDTTIVSVIPTLNNCSGDTVNYLIVVILTPFANILPSIFTGKPPLTVPFDNGSTINNNYDWDFGNGETSSLFSPPNITYENSGTYLATLVVTDPITGCSSSAQVTIEVLGELIIITPTIFTPNGDGINDIFNAVIENSESYSMTIYNRWGTSIFETNSLETGWDGTRNGTKLSEGVYFFLIEYSFFKQGELMNNTVKGTVTLLK